MPDFITLKMASAHARIIGDNCSKCIARTSKLHNVHDNEMCHLLLFVATLSFHMDDAILTMLEAT